MNKKEKAFLEILIKEILDALPDVQKVERIINSWVEANDLHPEEVITFSTKPREGG